MTTRTHPFRQRGGASTYRERAAFWMLRAFTYIILAFGVLIFSIIIWRGSPAVFGSFRVDGRAPYLHNDFLFTKPQTLHVFKYRGETKQMSADEFYKFTGGEEGGAPAPTSPPLAPQAAPEADSHESEFPGPNPFHVTNKNEAAVPPSVGPAPASAPAGATAINPADITDHETYNYAAGGIWPQIVGTVLLVIGSMAIALVLGVFSAIYLSEYSKQGPIISAIRLAIINLAGVPSIVFGLFGVALFVHAFGWNISMLAGWFTLAFMVLPVIITASEESLRAVPRGFREGSLALGATKWQTIRLNVLPYALPGILTSSVLGVARVAGETAPILFTAAYATADKLPWEISTSDDHLAPGLLGWLEFPFAWLRDFCLHPVNALPYHIYVVSSKIPQNEYTERVQYGTAFVFLAVVMVIAMASVVLRVRLRRRLKW
jgi:phosphate transport system permease protein